MITDRLAHAAIRALDWVAEKTLPAELAPAHLVTGRRGEEDAYFYLRGLGYVIVARNYRTPRRRGDLDLVGWEKDVLCFIEVKTRTTRAVKPAEAAVDFDKQRELSGMAREYLRHAPEVSQWRFDVISVYYNNSDAPPEFELFRNAFAVS